MISTAKPDRTVLDLAGAILEPGDPHAFERFARIVAELLDPPTASCGPLA